MSPEREGEEHQEDDLAARIISAAVLIPLAIVAAVAGGPWLAGAAGAAIVAMSFEWARMSEPGSLITAWTFGVIAALGAVMLASWGLTFWALAWLAVWAGASGLRRRAPVAFLETAGGVFYVGAPCVALLWLRAEPDGLQATIALFVIIWSVDVAAYIGGRAIGGPRIWPEASPHKTYAGTACGLAAGLAAGFACGEWRHAPALAWAMTGLVLGACGLAGDLLESLLKRRFGVKDASRLIPGHGGVLDRIDGLMLATSVAALTLALAPGVDSILWEIAR